MSQLITDRQRPTFYRAMAEHLHPEILLWIAKAKDRITDEWYRNLVSTIPSQTESFVELLELVFAFRETHPDAFEIAEDLKNHVNWPIDGEFVEIVNAGIKFTLERGHKQAITRWMMATGTRFDAKPGDKVTCNWNDKVLSGTVKSIDRLTATGAVNFDNDPPEQLFKIRAEALIERVPSEIVGKVA